MDAVSRVTSVAVLDAAGRCGGCGGETRHAAEDIVIVDANVFANGRGKRGVFVMSAMSIKGMSLNIYLSE